MTKIKVGDAENGVKPLTAEKLEKIIESYKVQNPVKYALNKEALDKQLAALKGETPKVEEIKDEEVAPVAPKAPKAPK